MAGFYDQNNPSTISNDEFIKLKLDPCIEYLGEIKDVKSEISKCKFYVLPSYREGTPRSVLEALATGRAIITTTAPGCNQTVINRINGIKVKPRNSIELANAMFELIGKTSAEITLMSNESRKLAETGTKLQKGTQIAKRVGYMATAAGATDFIAAEPDRESLVLKQENTDNLTFFII